MPTINNMPATLLDEHMNWHMFPGQPQKGGRAFSAGTPGSGLEFLTFHRAFVAHFHTWYDVQPGHDAAAVTAWTAIPPELKATSAWNPSHAAEELRIATNTPAFASADELGIYIETGIHNNFLHHASALAYNEPLLENPMTSPQSTHFYQLHGLVTNWWNHWASLQKGLGKEIIDNKHHHKELIKDKEIFLDNKIQHKEIEKIQKDKDFEKPLKDNDKFQKEIEKIQKDKDSEKLHKEIEKIQKDKDLEKVQKDKDKDKDLVENMGPIDQGDPAVLIHQLSQRITTLENQMAAGRAFIQPEERPDVGGQVVAGAGDPKGMGNMPGMGKGGKSKP